MWPTSIVVPAGYRFGVTVSGRDFEMPGDGPWPVLYGIPQRGNGVFMHDDPDDRPTGVFDATKPTQLEIPRGITGRRHR